MHLFGIYTVILLMLLFVTSGRFRLFPSQNYGFLFVSKGVDLHLCILSNSATAGFEKVKQR